MECSLSLKTKADHFSGWTIGLTDLLCIKKRALQTWQTCDQIAGRVTLPVVLEMRPGSITGPAAEETDMSEKADLPRFVNKLHSCVDDISVAARTCELSRRSEDEFVKVTCTAILAILREVRDYYAYYEEHIEKGFGELTSLEEDRVRNAVFRPFREALATASQKIHSSELLQFEITEAVVGLIDRWDSFQKEDVDRIITSDGASEDHP